MNDRIVQRVLSKDAKNQNKYPIKLGTILFCYDTLQVYVDIISPRRILIRNLAKLIVLPTESDRLSMTLEDIELKCFYYVSESNILYITNCLGDEVWEVMYQISAYENIDNYSTKNIYAQTFKFITEDERSPGSLVINPTTTKLVSVSVNSSNNSKQILSRYPEFGKMIFNGDFYLRKNDKIISVLDDGCID